MNCLSALPCDLDGNVLLPGAPPPPRTRPEPGDWAPFDSEVQFRIADIFSRRVEISASNNDKILEVWGESICCYDDHPPFNNHEEMHTKIDVSKLGDVPWQCMVTNIPENVDESTPWMQTGYEIWYCNPEAVVSNMLDNPDFDGQFDTRVYIQLDEDKQCRWSNIMSGNIAWHRSVSRMILLSLTIH
jgi:Plavaka transposase